MVFQSRVVAAPQGLLDDAIHIASPTLNESRHRHDVTSIAREDVRVFSGRDNRELQLRRGRLGERNAAMTDIVDRGDSKRPRIYGSVKLPHAPDEDGREATHRARDADLCCVDEIIDRTFVPIERDVAGREVRTWIDGARVQADSNEYVSVKSGSPYHHVSDEGNVA